MAGKIYFWLIQNLKENLEFHFVHIPCGSSYSWLKIDTVEGIRNFLVRNKSQYSRILCRDFNSPQAETIEGKVITRGQKILKNGQAVIVDKCRKENAWNSGERRVIEGLAEHDLPDIFRLLNDYKKDEFSRILSRKGRIIVRRRFDYIFASKKLNPKACHYLYSFRENRLSDHSAIEGIFVSK